MVKILTASKADGTIEKNLQKCGFDNIIGSVNNAADLVQAVTDMDEKPDVVVAVNGMEGSRTLPRMLLTLKRQYPEIRVVFIAGNINMSNENTSAAIHQLIEEGVKVLLGAPKKNDLIDSITAEDMNEEMDFEPEEADVVEDDDEEIPAISSDEDVVEKDNVFVVSSAKAGSGKSFVATNLSAIIAKYGKEKNGQKPTVLLVDGDLQTLSVGTLLGVTEKRYNLKNALAMIRTIIDDEGNVIGDTEQQRKVYDFIQDCCLLVDENIPNWATVVSASFNLEEREKVSPYHYFYLLNVLSSLFDIVIVDANSAMEHKTTGPIMQRAREVLMVVTSDFDGVRIASKASKELGTIGIDDKVGYILNKYPTRTQKRKSSEKPEFEPEDYFEANTILAKVPYIDQIVQYNRIYEHQPLTLDTSYESLPARIAFTKLANGIWPLDNFDELKAEVKKLETEISSPAKKKRNKK